MSEKDKLFIHCPQCDSDNVETTDYEDENGEEDTDGRRCAECNWEGDVTELVSIDEPGDHHSQ